MSRIVVIALAATLLAAPHARAWEQHECACAEVGGGTNYTHEYGRGGFGRPGYPVRGYEAIGPHYRGARPGIVAGTPAGLAAIGVAP
jgi:hypothetical protein